MPTSTPPQRRVTRRRSRLSPLLLLAGGWLALLLSLGVAQTAFAHPAAPRPLVGPPPNTSGTPSDTPTDTPGPRPTKTPSLTPSVTETITVTTTATRPPTRASGGNDQQPTRIVFTQPTVGASGAFDGAGIAADGGLNGFFVATITSCITTLLALVVTIVAFVVLRRDGYGPFLRLLLLGQRGRRRANGRGHDRGRQGRANSRARSNRGDW